MTIKAEGTIVAFIYGISPKDIQKLILPKTIKDLRLWASTYIKYRKEILS